MNDEEYVRKAVELADGIEFGEAEDQLVIQGETITSVYGLDILAAQLVRQVDALDTAWFESGIDAGAECSSFDLRKWGGSLDIADRTMNTIKAIVDSGVLEQ